MANDLNREVMQRLARLGAQARLEQIEMERKAILAAFPDLARGGTARQAAPAAAAPAKAARRRRSWHMNAAQRKEVSERMRKYWAERRKAKGK